MTSTPEHAALLAELDRVRRERDLYRRLLDLGESDEIDRFLEDALSLFVEISGAQAGYLELRDDLAGGDDALFWIAHGCYDADVEDIRASFSGGVIAEALATGKTIVTASALADTRFLNLESVKRNQTEAILCAPIGADPPFGVIYLQDREAGPFTEDDRLRVEVFARHIAPFADRLIVRRRQRVESDPTLPLRKGLCAEGLIGRSQVIARLLKEIAAAAPRDVGVLLTGASGTGKTMIARILHDSGPRRAGPFVEVNCAALPEQLLENELFGAVAGGHSAASKRVEGKVSAANGGTLFLDEIGELSLTAQAKLLQLLQSKEYFPLGSARPVRADVRVIAATNADLRAAVTRKAFREDLFYRLKVLPIRVPALAERREDLPDLARHFCERTCEEHSLPRLRLSVGAMRAIEVAEWVGNVRELAHAIEAAVLRATMEEVLELEPHHVFPETDLPDGEQEGPDSEERLSFQEATRRFQERLVRKKLEDTGWNITETAARLNLTRQHVYNLIRAFALERRRTGSRER